MSPYEVPSQPKIVALSKIFQYGKTQVPHEVRNVLHVEDGDKIVWYSESNKIFVKKLTQVTLNE